MSCGILRSAFIESAQGRLFALLRKPAGASMGGVLIVPPFAEEMNKSRHLFTEMANRLVERDVATVIVDLFGTGDSEGEFSDGDWVAWKSNLAAAIEWCRSEGVAITSMLAVRLGCALGCEMVREQGLQLQQTVFWQPVLSGSRALDQFLRLRVAATMMQAEGKETIAGIRTRIKGGDAVEVAGYQVNGRLAEQLDRVDLSRALSASIGAVHWIEIVRSADAAPPTPSLNVVEKARVDDGMKIELQTIQGEPFWSTVEIARNPNLIEHTVRSLGMQL